MPKSKLRKLPKGAQPEGSIVYHIEYDNDDETWHVDVRLDGKYTFSVIGKSLVAVSAGISGFSRPDGYDERAWTETLELTAEQVTSTMKLMEAEDES